MQSERDTIEKRLDAIEKWIAVHDGVCTVRGRVLWLITTIILTSTATVLVTWLGGKL